MPSRLFRFALLSCLIPLFALLAACSADAPAGPTSAANLPPEAIETLRLIQQDGPFPYQKDGALFHNREGLLPERPRGYYRAYTVPTPGARTRGTRRFVVGGDPPEVFYYTDDHYRSFRRIDPDS